MTEADYEKFRLANPELRLPGGIFLDWINPRMQTITEDDLRKSALTSKLSGEAMINYKAPMHRAIIK